MALVQVICSIRGIEIQILVASQIDESPMKIVTSDKKHIKYRAGILSTCKAKRIELNTDQ